MRYLYALIVMGWFTGLTVHAAVVSGQIVDEQGAPLPNASVFAEPSLESSLIKVPVAQDGRFSIDLPISEVTGIFAHCPGFAYGGVSVKHDRDDVQIVLRQPVSAKVLIENAKGKPVSNALISRVVLVDQRVSIPLAKLNLAPKSDDEGRLSIPDMPNDERILVKASHTEYAQEGSESFSVNKLVQVVLYRGVLVHGEVLSRNGAVPIAGATIMIKAAQGPPATSLTQSDGAGLFALRLKPGAYLYNVIAGRHGTAGWRPLTVRDINQEQRVTLRAGEMGLLHGKVCDAVSGTPVAGARLSVIVYGERADTDTTGTAGTYQFLAGVGEMRVTIEGAPGYTIPNEPTRVVTVAAGHNVELPIFWLMPLTSYDLKVVDEQGQPSKGCLVTLLRPLQFGTRVTNEAGELSFTVSKPPDDGPVLGQIESIVDKSGALFAIAPDSKEIEHVQLVPFSTVQGRVVDNKGQGCAGMLVGGAIRAEGWAEPAILWRTVTDSAGRYTWHGIVPGAAQRCVVFSNGQVVAESEPFGADSSSSYAINDIAVDSGDDTGRSLQGSALTWYRNPVLSGEVPDRKTRRNLPALVIYCTQEESEMTLEALEVLTKPFTNKLMCALVVDGGWYGPNSTIPILRGSAPGRAHTYLLDDDGNVVMETFGLPPHWAVRQVTDEP